jgi:ATP-dependent Clp protease ATP-binding subunit ClpB
MMQGEREKLLHMEDALHERVVGQHEAIVAVSDAIRRSRAGLGILVVRMVLSCSLARLA